MQGRCILQLTKLWTETQNLTSQPTSSIAISSYLIPSHPSLSEDPSLHQRLKIPAPTPKTTRLPSAKNLNSSGLLQTTVAPQWHNSKKDRNDCSVPAKVERWE